MYPIGAGPTAGAVNSSESYVSDALRRYMARPVAGRSR